MIDKLTDDEVISILKQKDEWLSRVSQLSPDRIQKENLVGGEANKISTTTHELEVYALPQAITDRGIRGIYFHVRRKGGGHNDSNWGRIGTQHHDARNYSYSLNNYVGDMFSFGRNESYEEIWTPTWIGTPYSYTWHTEVELEFREGFFNPPLRYPLEHFGWYGVSPTEDKKAEYRINITIHHG